MVYEERTYRNLYEEKDLYHFQVVIDETDLDIAIIRDRYSQKIYNIARDKIIQLRYELKEYIKRDIEFYESLKPHSPLPLAPVSIVEMCEKTKKANVGPMAAVAGLFAEQVGKALALFSSDVIVENGGDIWLKTSAIRRVGLYAGDSVFTARVALEVSPSDTPLGICTSSATVGHSLSFGKADAVVILSPSAVLADAMATAVCNMVKSCDDLERAVDHALEMPGVIGAIAILGDKMAVKGRVKLVPID
ncbi:MAG: hypothetical protein CVU87_09285 [Firmicutes bacterium HGW-Firmicutes-12]|nr:MAG: hypothetical protein CVU87_09285 [Firmicutes bacterium HGW-Firmicutes-12]